MWTWSAEKDAQNRNKHGLPLSLGEVGLEDPLAYSAPDEHPEGDRWDTICEVEGVVLYIVHTWPSEEGEANHPRDGRIISVREATAHEKRAYRDG
jgi:uncharacterized DUF497 family protein